MSEQYGLDWVRSTSNAGRSIFPKPSTETPDQFPSTSIAVTALKELRGPGKAPKAMPVFPSARTGESLQGSRGWFPSALEEAKIEGTPGIATTIPLQVDS
jgi:hypothetical protein